MKVALIQCPAWVTTAPPYALSLLGSALKRDGHEVRCFDLNTDIYLAIKNSKNNEIHINPDSWTNYKIENDFTNTDFINELFEAFEKIINEAIDEILSFNPCVICFSVHATSNLFSYELTRIIKGKVPEKVVFWGGPYCFVSYENLNRIRQIKPEIDVVCSGDGESDLPALLTYYENNGKFKNTRGYWFRLMMDETENYKNDVPTSDIDNIPFADLSFFKQDNYSWEHLPVMISRGCVNRCSFCNEWTCWNKYQFRDPVKVADEIKYQLEKNPRIKTFWLTCSNMGGNIQEVKKFCDLLIQEQIHITWDSQLAIRKELTPELLKKMKEAGCNYLHYGLESASNRVLRLMNKGYERKLAARVLMDTAKANISFNFNLIVGFPGENTLNFIETLFFVKRFLRYGIASSVAACNIPINSSLNKHYEKYHIISHGSSTWRTINNRNTYKIRQLRMYFTRQLYNSKIINLFHLAYRLLKKNSFLSLLFHYFSYFIFFAWVSHVFFILAVISVYNSAKAIFIKNTGKTRHDDSEEIKTIILFEINKRINPETAEQIVRKQTNENLIINLNKILDHYNNKEILTLLYKEIEGIPAKIIIRELKNKSNNKIIEEIEKTYFKQGIDMHRY